MTVSGLRDNYIRSTASEFLQHRLRKGSSLRAVSAYFSMYAYYSLREKLADLHEMRFLFVSRICLRKAWAAKVLPSK